MVVFLQVEQVSSGDDNRKKLSGSYTPVLCTQRYEDNTVEVQDLWSGRTTKSAVHVSRLKCFPSMNYSLYLALEGKRNPRQLCSTPDPTTTRNDATGSEAN
jgi:hypothetical protein